MGGEGMGGKGMGGEGMGGEGMGGEGMGEVGENPGQEFTSINGLSGDWAQDGEGELGVGEETEGLGRL